MPKIVIPTSGTRPVYAGNIRISDDPEVLDPGTGLLCRQEKGITRQKEDIVELASRLGVEIGAWYEENDVSAFKKKRIRLPNGRSVWRVIRPDFREMLEDYEDGRIEGIIYYDLDRMTRQNRDLEDLIDLVEFYKRPVETVTGHLDLRTSSGRAMARVMVAMGNKASEDTARRVARARLQQAQEGVGRTFRSRRPFGYQPDGTLNQAEAKLIGQAARRFLAGESWSALVRLFTASGIPPVKARDWTSVSIKQILLSPAVAGIAVYNGSLRADHQEASGSSGSKYVWADPEGMALKDAAGNYILGRWAPIVTVEQWQRITAEQARRVRDAGASFGGTGTKKHLLSGLLRCGRIRQDGSICYRSLLGSVRKRKSGTTTISYKCPPKAHGGCSGIERNAAKLEELIEELLFAHITANAPADLPAEPDPGSDPQVIELAEVQRKLAKIRTEYPQGKVSDDTFFVTLPVLEAQEKRLKAAVNRKRRQQAGTAARRRSPQDIRTEWDQADVSGKRAILAQYLDAVVVGPSTTRSRGEFDYQAITPVWKTTPAPQDQ